MSQQNCNDFSSLEIIAARKKKKNDECYQLNEHDWNKTFGKVMYVQIQYNYNDNFPTYYMFANSVVLQNSKIYS